MPNKESQFYEFGHFRIDPNHRLLLRENQPLPLQSKAFDVLVALVENRERVVLKDDLLKMVWPETFVEESNLAQHIFVLRKVLGETAGESRYIVTVPGRGYRFAAKVNVISEEESLTVATKSRSRVVIEDKSTGRAWFSVGVIAIATLIGGVLYWRSHRVPKLTERDSIVLADFANSTGDPVFDGTLRQGLSAQLEQSPFLNLLSDQRTAQTLTLMAQPRDARLTPELAREVCLRTGSAAVLDGSIAQVGTQYLLVLKALNCSSGESLAAAEAQAKDKDHVLDALGKVASEMRGKLGESLASVHKYDAPPEDVTTSSLEALQAYSLGYRTMQKDDLPAAIPLFQRAINLDPSFAMADARLGMTFYNLDEPSRAEESLRKAYDLRERLSQREKLYVAASYEAMAKGNMEEARKSYELWHQIYPRDPFAVSNLGIVYGYLGDDDKALAAIQEAWRLNPGNGAVFSNMVATYLELGRLDEATAFASKAKDLHVESIPLYDNLYLLDFVKHDAAGMEREANELIGKPGWDDLMLYRESDTAAYEGHLSSARTLTQRAVDSARRADKSETAASYEAESAVREALVGNLAAAERQANAALAFSHGKEVEAIAAIARGLAGDSLQAARLADDLNQRFPEDTSVQVNFLPTIRAALALQSGHEDKAQEALVVAQPYELGATTQEISFSLYPLYLRAEAYLAEKQGAAAAAEFQKILDHPGYVVNEPIGALAHLGVARANTLQSRTSRGADAAAARIRALAAYKDFLTLWKDADPDIPILNEAKAEYAKLQ